MRYDETKLDVNINADLPTTDKLCCLPHHCQPRKVGFKHKCVHTVHCAINKVGTTQLNFKM